MQRSKFADDYQIQKQKAKIRKLQQSLSAL
jgi:hypothetical protein